MTSIEFERVECYRVKGLLFTCTSKWNGMEEWRDEQGRIAIISRDSDGFTAAFSNLFADAQCNHAMGHATLISASPDLIAELVGRAD